jgi:hypothetical protein
MDLLLLNNKQQLIFLHRLVELEAEFGDLAVEGREDRVLKAGLFIRRAACRLVPCSF